MIVGVVRGLASGLYSAWRPQHHSACNSWPFRLGPGAQVLPLAYAIFKRKNPLAVNLRPLRSSA
jgi:hypothetical protein